MSSPYAPQVLSSRSPPPGPASSSSDSSSTATIASNNNIANVRQTLSPVVDRLEPASDPTTAAQKTPSNDAIEAVIRAAISSEASRASPSLGTSGKGGGDGRTVPPRDTRTQLFVGNLPYRVRWQDLKDLFRRAGTVLRADVSLGADNRSRGYGTVLLATAEDAGRAIDMFNGYEWQGRMLEVRVDKIGGPMTGETATMSGVGYPAPMMGGVHIGNNPGMYQQVQGFSPSPQFASQTHAQNPAFPPRVQPSSQQQHIFSPQPQHVSLGHIQTQFQIHGQSHFEQLQSQHYHGQQQQQPVQQHPPSIPGRTLFVGNLPYHVQWQDLKDLFRRTPGGVTVLRADVALGPDGRSKGFGTVTLRTEEEAERAKRWFSGYEFSGRQLKVHHDRVPLPPPSNLLHLPQALHSAAASPAHASSPTLLSQQLILLNMGDTLSAERHSYHSRRSSSPSNTASSSSSRGQFPYVSSKLRTEAIPNPPQSPHSTHTSATVQSLSSPLLRQIQAYQQEQAQSIHQPSPIPPSANRGEIRHARSHSGSVSGGIDFSLAGRSSVTSPSSQAASPTLSASPSVSRANRPTHITLPAPSFKFDFDPSMGSLDYLNPHNPSSYDADLESDSGEWSRKESHSSVTGSPEATGIQQTTPLQMHFQHFLRKENVDGEFRQEDPREYHSSPPPPYEQQLHQLLHGSRQVSAAGSARGAHMQQQSPIPSSLPASSLSQSKRSAATGGLESGYSSNGSQPDERDRGYSSAQQQRSVRASLRSSLSSSSSSAANSSKSLPLAFGDRERSTSSSADKVDIAGRPQSVVSTTGSTTSASESGMSTSLSGSSRTGSSVPPVSAMPRIGLHGNTRQGEMLEKREKEKANPRHPGSITLPPPPQVVFPASGREPSRSSSKAPPLRAEELSGAGVGKELFQQYHPFTKLGQDEAVFEQSGTPTIQAKRHATGGSDAGSVSSRKSGKESDRHKEVQQWSEAYHHYQQAYQQQYFHQAPVTPSHHPAYPQAQLTPHGLPPMTPSMPPFTFVGTQMTPGYHSPAGMYPPGIPTSPGGPSHFQQRRARMVSDAHQRHHPNAPGTLSLPPQQFAFVQHQQSPPILSPASTIGPGTAGMPPHSYLLPLGSPGSPYALGPHHPLHHGHQPSFQTAAMYNHIPHPLSHSFGHTVGPLGAISPGAPWGRPGEIQPYGNAAVGGPLHRARGEHRSNRSRSRSVSRENEQQDQGDMSQRPYAPPSGYWMYSQPMVEPKGYFDQLYMNSSTSRQDAPDTAGTAAKSDHARTEGQQTVEREIMKDKSSGQETVQRPPLVAATNSSHSSGTAHRMSSTSTTDRGSPDTLATSPGEDGDEMRRFVPPDSLQPTKSVVGMALAPRLHHSQTDPGKGAEAAPQPSRRATAGEASSN